MWYKPIFSITSLHFFKKTEDAMGGVIHACLLLAVFLSYRFGTRKRTSSIAGQNSARRRPRSVICARDTELSK